MLPASPPVESRGETRETDAETESFTFLFLNIQGFTSHEAELSVMLESLGFPHFLGLNETFLPGEGIVKEVLVPGHR